MPTILYKPTSPGKRFRSGFDFAEITRDTPEPTLLAPLRKSGGRNNLGRITTRHRGGGHKRRYRVVDFRRNKENVPARVAAVEYDPNRSARLALLHYADGEKSYILAPIGLRVGDNETFGRQMQDLFENDVQYSKKIDPREWRRRPTWDRFVQWAVSRARMNTK